MPLKEYPITLPTFYDEFQCKGGVCRNTCCQRWTIDISRRDYNKICHCLNSDQAKTLFKRRSRKEATDLKYAIMQLDENGMCPLLTEDRMCGLQLEHGYQMLPGTCKRFPRMLTQTSPGQFSLSLDTSCEYTLELLWKYSQTGLKFITRNEPLPKVGYSIISSSFCSEFIEDIRNLCIWILQNRAYSLSDRMLILGLAMQELQKIQDANAVDQLPAWFVKWQSHTKGNEFQESLSELKGNTNLFVLNNLRTLLCITLALSHGVVNAWFSLFAKNFSVCIEEGNVISFNDEEYRAIAAQFVERFPHIDHFFENYMVLTLFRKTFPFDLDSVWKSYAALVSFYSSLRFLAIATMPKTAENLIDAFTTYSRGTLNSSNFSDTTAGSLQETQSDSLAHLAILIRG